jgi:hypothetical protein
MGIAGARLVDEAEVATGTEAAELKTLLSDAPVPESAEESDDSVIAEDVSLREEPEEVRLDPDEEETCAVKRTWLRCRPQVRERTKRTNAGRIRRRSRGTS